MSNTKYGITWITNNAYNYIRQEMKEKLSDEDFVQLQAVLQEVKTAYVIGCNGNPNEGPCDYYVEYNDEGACA